MHSDAFFLFSPGTFALFNPLGGWAGIELCSTARAAFQLDMGDLTDALARANRVVAAAVASNPRLRGGGCTAAAIQLSGGRCTVAWVGDVHVLRFRDGELTELTRVHSLEDDFLRRGVPPAGTGEAGVSKIIVRALGMSDKVEVEVVADATRERDVYLLVSAPVNEAVGKGPFASIVAVNRSDPHACARALIESAAANGARDVLSVLTIALGDGNDTAAAPAARWDAEPSFAPAATAEEEAWSPERERSSRLGRATPFERALRSWRTAKTPRDAWRRFRSWIVQTGISADGDVPVDAHGMQSHHLWTGPATKALVLFEKHHVMTMLSPDVRGSDRGLATGSVPFAPRALDVDLIRAGVRVLGGVPLGYVGDLDPHGLHVFGALRSGDLDAPDIHGRRLRIEWLGIDDAWVRSTRKTDRPLRARQIPDGMGRAGVLEDREALRTRRAGAHRGRVVRDAGEREQAGGGRFWRRDRRVRAEGAPPAREVGVTAWLDSEIVARRVALSRTELCWHDGRSWRPSVRRFTMLAVRYDGARKLAGLWVDVVSDGEAIVLDDMTMDRPYGWVFFYQARRFVETRDPMHRLGGNAPIIINRFSDELRGTGTAHPIAHYLAEYEATLPTAQMQATSQRRTR